MEFSDKYPFKPNGDSFGAHIVQHLSDPFTKPRGFVEINSYPGPVGCAGKKCIFSGYSPLTENLVVTMARRVMSRVCAGAPNSPTITTLGGPVVITDPAQIYIAQMRWGTGGHDPLNPTQPIDPLPADEDLYTPISSPAFKTVTVDYPDDLTVRFTATLGQSEANGNGLSEVGLFTASHDLMFARKTHGILTKTSAFSFEYKYSIIY